MQTLTLATMLDRAAMALAGNQGLLDFCDEKYGKPPKVFVTVDAKNLPGAEHCPMVVLIPNFKEEGILDAFTYDMTAAWSIVNKDAPDVDGIIVKPPGFYESDALGQLVLAVMAETFRVIKYTYSIDPVSSRPQYPGRADMEIEVPVPRGSGTISF